MTTNAMIAQIESLPELIQTEFEGLDERARTILSHEEWLSVKRIVTTGCGDSHMAAVATQWAFERLGGVPTDAATALRAARYALPEATDRVWRNPLTIGISVSGSVSRTREAVAAAKERGFLTIAVTGNRVSVGTAVDGERFRTLFRQAVENPADPEQAAARHQPASVGAGNGS